MQSLKEKIEKTRQELYALAEELRATAELNDHYPNFGTKTKCEKAALWVQQANGKLFYALTALGNR